MARGTFLAACLFAAVVPLRGTQEGVPTVKDNFPGWPETFEGRALKRLPLDPREEEFFKGFPGEMARFTDGRRRILIRWVGERTRKLHPSSDCYKSTGWSVKPAGLEPDENGNLWSTFEARRGEEHVSVSATILDTAGNSWADVSSWYWAALFGKTSGPWWAYTVAS